MPLPKASITALGLYTVVVVAAILSVVQLGPGPSPVEFQKAHREDPELQPGGESGAISGNYILAGNRAVDGYIAGDPQAMEVLQVFVATPAYPSDFFADFCIQYDDTPSPRKADRSDRPGINS